MCHLTGETLEEVQECFRWNKFTLNQGKTEIACFRTLQRNNTRTDRNTIGSTTLAQTKNLTTIMFLGYIPEFPLDKSYWRGQYKSKWRLLHFSHIRTLWKLWTFKIKYLLSVQFFLMD